MSSSSRYSVRTIDRSSLATVARNLYALAKREFPPQLIVGIRTGGYRVAAAMGHETDGVRLLPLTCRRPGTARKRKLLFVQHWLRFLPYAVTDRLRLIEHRLLLATARNTVTGDRTLDPEELATIAAAIQGGMSHILIVDDAVDSGSTLQTVGDTLKKLGGPMVAIKTAAITVTTPDPLIDPDYTLYRHVLCRFPWSFDFRS